MNCLATGEWPARPVIIPVALGQINGALKNPFVQDRGDKQVGTKEKFVVNRGNLFIAGKLEEQRTHCGQAAVAGLLHHVINVRQQFIAQLDRTLVDGLESIAKRPRFFVRRAKLGVRAHEWEKHPGLQPPGVKLARRRSDKTADVGAHKRKS